MGEREAVNTREKLLKTLYRLLDRHRKAALKAKKAGNTSNERNEERKIMLLRNETKKISSLSIEKFIQAYPSILARLQKEFPGEFELKGKSQQAGKYMIFFAILAGVVIARFFGEQATFLFVILAIIAVAYYFMHHKGQQKLVPAKA